MPKATPLDHTVGQFVRGASVAPVYLSFAVVASFSFLSACTSITVEGAEVLERHYPGITIIEIKPFAQRAAVVQTTGIGLTVGGSSTTVGYLRETLFVAFDSTSCRTMIVVETDDQVATLALAIDKGKLSELCVLKQKDSK